MLISLRSRVMDFDFEWDSAKALANTKTHGVTFEDAAGVQFDPLALTVFDQTPSRPLTNDEAMRRNDDAYYD